jgi:hypothetical protein
MSMFIHGRLGHYLQDEAGAEGAPSGGGTDAAQAPAATDAPASVEASSLLGELKPDAATDLTPPDVKADDKPAEGEDGEKKDDKPAEGAPEVYEAFKAPDGIELDEAVMPEIHEIFKDLGLPQDKAQEIFEKFLGIQEKLAGTPEQQMQAAEQQIVALNSRLAEECKNLPDIGGEKFGESLTIASKVMQQFGSPEFRQLIAYTGVGSHPEFFKMMVAIGSKMSPDNFVQGGEEARTERRGEEIMFGHLFQK